MNQSNSPLIWHDFVQKPDHVDVNHFEYFADTRPYQVNYDNMFSITQQSLSINAISSVTNTVVVLKIKVLSL